MNNVYTDLEISQSRSGVRVHGTIENECVEVYYFYLSFSDLKQVKRRAGDVAGFSVINANGHWSKKGRHKKDFDTMRLASIIDKFLEDSGYNILEVQ